MILIVGLGNYGIEYNNTNHNCGFAVVDRLAVEAGVEITKKRCKSLIFEGHLFGEKVVIAKPQTYMNLSGEAVVDLCKAYKPEKILIVYDDIDLPYGTIRYRQNGSAGTHNGMRSVVKHLSTTDISRLRIGVKPQEPIYNLADFVLSKVSKQYIEEYENSIDLAYEKIKEFILKKGNI